MTANGIFQLLLYLTVLLALVKPLGWFMARVFQGKPCGLDRVLGPLERLIYRLAGVKPDREMGWKTYAAAAMLSTVLLYVISAKPLICLSVSVQQKILKLKSVLQ